MWDAKKIEKLKMDHPYATISELVDMLSDTATYDEYSPLSDAQKQKLKHATSLKEKKAIKGQPVKKAPVARANTTPTVLLKDEQKERVSGMVDRIRKQGRKSMTEIIQEYAAKGMVPVRLPGGGVKFVKA